MKNRHQRIVDKLIEMYPDAKCELEHRSAFELLIATMLSAQSTDKQVNIVTQELFKEYNTPEKIGTLSESQLGDKIKSIGFYNTKARNIIKTTHILLEDYSGEVPCTMDQLIRLPGVGRKTANVVLSNVFDILAFAVDTHVMRVTQRLNLTKNHTPDEIELDITKKIAPQYYTIAHHCFIFHGRRVCKARNPLCTICQLQEECSYFKNLM